MADEREDTIIYDECADDLSDVPIDIADWEEDIADPTNESKAESSDSEILARRIRRTVRLASYSDESEEDDSVPWSGFDLPRTNDEFKGFPGPNIFPEETERRGHRRIIYWEGFIRIYQQRNKQVLRLKLP
ncbi:hypothetical protein ANTRET_LOCUS7657 [Anthophora retusa]